MDVENTRPYSYSRLTSFSHCKYEYFLKYIIDNDELYLNEGNYYAEVGSFMHHILELVLKGELSFEDAYEYYIDKFDDYVFYETSEKAMRNTYEKCEEYLLDLKFDWLENCEVIGSELEVEFTIHDRQFIGYIDVLLRDKNDGKLIVLDHKSSQYPFKKDGGVKKAMEENFQSYKRQLYIYAHAVKQLYGEFPKELKWNCFKDGGAIATIPFSKKEYNAAIKWVKKTLEEINKEEDFPETVNWFYCNHLCGFRDSCEYKEV